MGTVRFCPKCKSTNVTVQGVMTRCRECDFSNENFPEINSNEISTLKKVKKKIR